MSQLDIEIERPVVPKPVRVVGPERDVVVVVVPDRANRGVVGDAVVVRAPERREKIGVHHELGLELRQLER
jgi:hypothetical protein